ncbi:UNVERIFIED_CONTAM: hypothetical protein FKN15_007428 [Acipenser sinensis]
MTVLIPRWAGPSASSQEGAYRQLCITLDLKRQSSEISKPVKNWRRPHAQPMDQMVQHPAARMIVMASHMQEQEVGDGTNFVLVFAGALLELAEELLRMGLSVSEDKRLVPGAGATEIELAKHITSYGESCPGLEQYAIKKFAEAFEAIPRALAENSGVKGNELISKLYAVHQEGNKNIGFDIEGEGAAVKDMLEAGILDPYLVKHWGIKLATNSAVTVLRVDQIIMAKPAGGPKAPQAKKDWDEDQE